MWANLAKEVYHDPRPTHIKGVMRRVRAAVANFDEKTLVRMVHGLPAKMQKIYELKGHRLPKNFDSSKSLYACTCVICSE